MKSFLSHFILFRFSKNWSYVFAFGFLLFFVLFIQVASGVILALGVNNYTHVAHNVHSVTASIIMLFTYIHFYKSFFYRVDSGLYSRGSFISGLVVFIILMCVSFTGYVVPWGQISY